MTDPNVPKSSEDAVAAPASLAQPMDVDDSAVAAPEAQQGEQGGGGGGGDLSGDEGSQGRKSPDSKNRGGTVTVVNPGPPRGPDGSGGGDGADPANPANGAPRKQADGDVSSVPVPAQAALAMEEDEGEADREAAAKAEEERNRRHKKKQKVLEKIQKYKKSITEGCGRFACPSPYCRSNLSHTVKTLQQTDNGDGEDEKEEAPNVVSKRCITLLKAKTKHCSQILNDPKIDDFLEEMKADPESDRSKAVVKQAFENITRAFKRSFLPKGPPSNPLEEEDEKKSGGKDEPERMDEDDPSSPPTGPATSSKELAPDPPPPLVPLAKEQDEFRIPSQELPAIDFDKVGLFHSLLEENDELAEVAQESIMSSLTSFGASVERQLSKGGSAPTQNHRDLLRVILILLENPLIVSYDPDTYELLYRLGPCFVAARNHRDQLSKWIANAYSTEKLKDMLYKLMQLITIKYEERRDRKLEVSKINELLIWTKDLITPICLAIDCIYRANKLKIARNETDVIDYKEFYNDSLNEQTAASREFPIINWLIYKQPDMVFFPWLLDAGSKADLLLIDARQAMGRHAVQIEVRRDHLVADSLDKIQFLDGNLLRKRLRIVFHGEEGVDEGGVRKEFFTLLVQQLMDVKFGMFLENPDTRQFWFNPSSFDNNQEFELIGIIFGLAIYQSVIIEVPFPSCLYKKLLNLPLSWEDFEEFEPVMAKNLKSLKTFSKEQLEGVDLTFTYTFNIYGMGTSHDLKEGGDKIAVTPDNVDEYVELYWKYKLNTSIAKQFNAFKEGFTTVMYESTLKMFSPPELELLIAGKKVYDWEELEKHCRYDGFKKDSDYIKSFWKIIHELDEEDKRRFLTFSTGSDRVPVRGLAQLRLKITKHGDSDENLPTSHTCFAILLLPEYSSADILKEKLKMAITWGERGFGML